MKHSFFIIVFALLISSCGGGNFAPKPRGYFRIDLPEKSYQNYTGNCPFSFEYPKYTVIYNDSSSFAEPCWINIVYPEFKGRLHLSYKSLDKKGIYEMLTEDARKLAFKHTIKAESIDQYRISNSERKVYGLIFGIEGNTASNLQFFLTDSSQHYLRGALYFAVEPKADSIQPVLDFVKQDVERFIETLEWK
jgi:gliding motility-associated lipoprotein GldD